MADLQRCICISPATGAHRTLLAPRCGMKPVSPLLVSCLYHYITYADYHAYATAHFSMQDTDCPALYEHTSGMPCIGGVHKTGTALRSTSCCNRRPCHRPTHSALAVWGSIKAQVQVLNCQKLFAVYLLVVVLLTSSKHNPCMPTSKIPEQTGHYNLLCKVSRWMPSCLSRTIETADRNRPYLFA